MTTPIAADVATATATATATADADTESAWSRVGRAAFAGFAATVAVAALGMAVLLLVAIAGERSFAAAFEAAAWGFVFMFALLMWPMVIVGGVAGFLRAQRAMLWFAPAVATLALLAVADHSHGWVALYGLGLGLALGVGFVSLERVARRHAAGLVIALTVTMSVVLTEYVSATRLLASVLYGLVIGAVLVTCGRLLKRARR